MEKMEIGEVVDFLEEYNRMHEDNSQKGRSRGSKSTGSEPSRREATQTDWDDFWG